MNPNFPSGSIFVINAGDVKCYIFITNSDRKNIEYYYMKNPSAIYRTTEDIATFSGWKRAS